MNFRALFIFVIILHVSSCGVKAPPVTPPETAVSSYIETFTGTPPEQPKSIEKKKK